MYKLRKFSSELSLFHSSHPLQTPLGELHVEKEGEGRILVQEDSSFSERVLQWHRDFLSLQVTFFFFTNVDFKKQLFSF